jgi:hypothetical protein
LMLVTDRSFEQLAKGGGHHQYSPVTVAATWSR